MKVPKTSRDKYVVDAVDRALDVLESFGDSEKLGLVEISRRVNLNKSRAFRLLYTLHERGYIDRTADGLHYKLGLRLFEHATHFRRDLKTLAEPYVRRLHARFNETVNLAVIHNHEVLYIDLFESSRPFRMSAMVGSRMPLFSTSLGKAMAAHLPEQELTGVLSALSAAQAGKLSKELRAIRERGYALDEEENEPGVACIGAAIFDRTGTAIGAMSVSGSVGRILKQHEEIGSMLMQMCSEVSRHMGCARAELSLRRNINEDSNITA